LTERVNVLLLFSVGQLH